MANTAPNIVRDRLTLYLDPSNPKCYISGSPIVYDLSQNRDLSQRILSGTLTNSPTFDSSQNCFGFSGSESYIRTNCSSSQIINTNDWTVSIWIKPTGENITRSSPDAGQMILCDNDYPASYGWYAINRTYVTTNGGDRLWVGNYPSYFGVRYVNDQWINITMTLTGSLFKGYSNGKLFAAGASGNTNLTYANSNTTLWLGQVNQIITTIAFSGSMGPVLAYQKGLTDKEVFQNFNAMRKRFGL